MALARVLLAGSDERVLAWVDQSAQDGPDWHDASLISNNTLAATVEEVKRLQDQIHALLRPYQLGNRRPQDLPDGTRLVHAAVRLTPTTGPADRTRPRRLANRVDVRPDPWCPATRTAATGQVRRPTTQSSSVPSTRSRITKAQTRTEAANSPIGATAATPSRTAAKLGPSVGRRKRSRGESSTAARAAWGRFSTVAGRAAATVPAPTGRTPSEEAADGHADCRSPQHDGRA